MGVNLPAPVVPYTTGDIYPSHLALYGKGGYRTVMDIYARNTLPWDRLEPFMLVVTADTGRVWQLTSMPPQGEPTTSMNWTEVNWGTEIDGGEF